MWFITVYFAVTVQSFIVSFATHKISNQMKKKSNERRGRSGEEIPYSLWTFIYLFFFYIFIRFVCVCVRARAFFLSTFVLCSQFQNLRMGKTVHNKSTWRPVNGKLELIKHTLWHARSSLFRLKESMQIWKRSVLWFYGLFRWWWRF